MLIYYCESCHARIPPADIDAGRAVLVDENTPLCAQCAAAKAAPGRKSGPASAAAGTAAAVPPVTPETRQSRTGIRPATRTSGVQVSGASSARIAPQAAARVESVSSRAVPAAPPVLAGASNKVPLIIGATGAVLFLIGLAVAMSRGDGSTPDANAGRNATAASTAPAAPASGATETKKQPEPAAPVRNLPSWMTIDQPKPERGATAASAAQTPAATEPRGTNDTKAAGAPPAAPVTEPPKPAAIVVPTAPNETVWVDEALPGGARPDGTAKADSWKWVTQPDPVYSGMRSHTQAGQGKSDEGRRHCFEGANPPLQANPWDTLFCYVYLDAKDPPKELMLQWQYRGGWEHRAYWGADEISLGSNFSPSRLSMGALPQAGQWVRLEVRGSEIGIEAENEAVTGWSFDQFGGTVYWDRAGLARGTKPAVAAVTPPPSQSTQAKPAAAPAAAGFLPSTLKKWMFDELHGRNVYGGNFGGKKSTAIWAKCTPHNSFSGSFELAFGRYGPGELVVMSFLHGSQPCLLSITINGQEIYNGRDKATQHGKWMEQRYPFAAGILRPGKNELYIYNMEPQGRLDADPWYMLHSAEITGALLPDFPPLLSETQRNTMQTYDRVFELLGKKELDAASKIDQALRAAKSVAAPELRGLVSVLEKAQALHTQALANLSKTPPAEPVQVEKLKLTGTVARIAGNKAYIKSQGIEMPVDVALLPQPVFLKALGLDETKPAGQADKAAYLLGVGSIEAAQQILKRLKKDDLPSWVTLFDQRAVFEKWQKFESAVGAIEAALKSSNGAEALTLLNALKKDFPDLVDANKERINYFAVVAEGPKK